MYWAAERFRHVVFVTGVAAMAGCGGGSSTPATHGKPGRETGGAAVSVSVKYAGGYPINVVCTTGMVGDLARRVGGERVKASQLMGEGVDPHLYKASPGDVAALNQADVIFYSGLHLEGKMAD